MKATYDRMLWFRKDEAIDLEGLKEDLTVRVDPFKGEPFDLQAWEETDEVIGVPRRLGLVKLPSAIIKDATVCPYFEWPMFRGEYWDGQYEAIESMTKALKARNGGLLDSGMGTGKTLMGLSIAAQLQAPALVIVHKNDLAEQWHSTGRKFFGIEGGHIQGAKANYEGHAFSTAMVQTLWRRRDKLPKELFKHFGLVIWDEGHKMAARTFENSMRSFYARYRLGVSATWRRPDGLDLMWQWHLGRVEHKTHIEKLGGKYLQVKWPTELKDKMFTYPPGSYPPNMGKFVTRIAKDEALIKWLAEQLVKGARAGRKFLLVSDRVEQLIAVRKLVEREILTDPLTSGFYVSSLPDESGKKKKQTRQQLNKAKASDIILATYQMIGEGTDIPEIDTLIFGTPRRDVEQVVGRIQRPVQKKELLIVDPVLNTPYNRDMGESRKRIYVRLGFDDKMTSKEKEHGVSTG